MKVQARITGRGPLRRDGLVFVDVETEAGHAFAMVYDVVEFARKGRRKIREEILAAVAAERSGPFAASVSDDIDLALVGFPVAGAVTLAVAIFVAIAVAVAVFVWAGCQSNGPEAPAPLRDERDAAALAWFETEYAVETPVMVRHFETAANWEKAECRKALRAAIVFGGAAQSARNAPAIEAAKKVLRRFSRDEVFEFIRTDSAIPDGQRSEFMRRAGRLIDG